MPFCVACGSTENLHHHHIVPKSLGGSDDDTNLITLCAKHHGQIHNARIAHDHSELTRKGLARVKAAGKPYGPIPYGKRRLDDKLVENPIETEIISLIAQLKESGLNYSQVAEKLNEMGYVKRNDLPWERWTARKVYVRHCT